MEANHALPAEFRLYEPLILEDDQEEEENKSFLERINPNSLEVLQGFVEAQLKGVAPQTKFQFFRHGYFNVDPKYTTAEKPVFNRIVSLKSSFKL
ncbi:glutamine--tRNA ligase [Carboxydocella sp. ULO1]|nr:glutamine--tRNA ligase [Carboxydocella sp. ULO1]